jgi:hypothetical protein
LDSPGHTVIGARSGVWGGLRTIANGRCSNVITAHQASLPQARRPSGAQPAVCMGLNDLTVSPVTATCENRRHQGRVRERSHPVAARRFGLNGGKPEAGLLRAIQLLRSWRRPSQTPAFLDTNPTTVATAISRSHLVMRPGFPRGAGRISRSRLRPETCRRRFKLAFESAIKSGFGLVTNFGCNLCHRIISRGEHLRS